MRRRRSKPVCRGVMYPKSKPCQKQWSAIMSKNTTRAGFVRMRFAASMMAVGIILIGAGVAQASDKEECSNATLNGLYAFHASGFNIVAGVAQPKAIVEIIQFNGD